MANITSFTTLDPNATGDEGCGTWDELWLTCFTSISIEVIVEVLIFAYSFVGLAIVCDDYLVQSLETLCARWNIREDVAGASFVAFGSAAPEIIINSITTIKSAGSDTGAGADLGVSAIIGSGMIAFLLIPGCCGVFSSKVLPLKRRPLLRDSLTYLAALIILCVFMSNGTVELYEGLVLTGKSPTHAVVCMRVQQRSCFVCTFSTLASVVSFVCYHSARGRIAPSFSRLLLRAACVSSGPALALAATRCFAYCVCVIRVLSLVVHPSMHPSIRIHAGAYIVYILVVYLAPQIRFKWREAQAKKRGETIKRYESFVKSKTPKATTVGEFVDDAELGGGGDGRDRSSSDSLLANNYMSDPTSNMDNDMDASLLADMGTHSHTHACCC